MIYMAMAFALVSGAVIQALLPAWGGVGNVKAPILLGVTVYYALYQPRRVMLVSAVAGGLLQDALGLLPLGYSTFCFIAAGLVLEKFRNAVFEHAWITHVVVGALCSGLVTLLCAALLLVNGYDFLEPVLFKLAGSLLLGGFTIHFVVVLVLRLDTLLGNEPWESA